MDTSADRGGKLGDLITQRLKKGEKLTVSLDYGVHDKGNPRYEMDMAEWAQEGFIGVSDTEATLEEFNRAGLQAKKLLEPKMTRFPKLMPDDPAEYGKMRYGRSAYGSPSTTRDGKHIYQVIEEFQKLMFPDFHGLEAKNRINAYYDILHISCHYIFHRDVFLTRNLKHFEKIMERCPNVVITCPEKFVEIGKECF